MELKEFQMFDEMMFNMLSTFASFFGIVMLATGIIVAGIYTYGHFANKRLLSKFSEELRESKRAKI